MSVNERLDATNKRRLLLVLAGAVLLLLVPLLYAVTVGFPASSEARVTCQDGSTVEIPTGQKVEDVCATP